MRSILYIALLAGEASTLRLMAPPAPRAAAPSMLLELPRPAAWGGAPWGAVPQQEVMMEGGSRITFAMENLHLTKRRVSGSVVVDAPAEAVWATVTDYERHPDFIPSIVSHAVSRDANGEVTLEQVSLLSRKLNLRTQMRLRAVEDPKKLSLLLMRVSGHGFLEFEGRYSLVPRADGKTALSYSVELVPCPIFPLPLVERKIRKEVPKMLAAVAQVSQRR